MQTSINNVLTQHDDVAARDSLSDCPSRDAVAAHVVEPRQFPPLDWPRPRAMGQLARAGAVLAHYRWSQLARRVVSLVKRRWMRATGAGAYLKNVPDLPAVRITASLLKLSLGRVQARAGGHADEVLSRYRQGEVRFLNVSQSIRGRIDWRVANWPDAPLLWRFHLHYHEFLLDFAAAGGTEQRDLAIAEIWPIVGDWIAANPLGDARSLADAWHPYCISRRIPVWISLLSTYPPEDAVRRDVLRSLYAQAKFLSANLERELGGNHLLENARALAWAGTFFEGNDAASWWNTARQIFEAELPRQILPHGEHFERSPRYHADMLDAVLDVRDLAGERDAKFANRLDQTSRRMADFLARIVSPGGWIPLLSDSVLEGSFDVQRLLSRAAATQSFSPTESAGHCAITAGPYWVWNDAGHQLLFDAGQIGAPHLPAHAHADLLTIEASIDGRPFITDSGVHDYNGGEMRQFCRSTAAHNVPQVDRLDHAEMWSRFRMGRRGSVRPLRTEQVAEFDIAWSAHDAYQTVGVPELGRFVACRPGGPWIIADWLKGEGEHSVTNRLHLHPDVRVFSVEESAVELSVGERTLWLRALTPGRVEVQTGIYCSEFGVKLDRPVVCWTSRGRGPLVCGWVLDWSDAVSDVNVVLTPAREVNISLSEGDERVILFRSSSNS